MIIVGLTGGIGSGKTTVAGFFKDLGVPIYVADDAAKNLMNTDHHLQKEIKTLLGEEAYSNGVLNRAYVSSIVFSDKVLLEKLNSIVHPAVQADFEKWCASISAKYVIKEAAVLFENEGYKLCDYTIIVTAPKVDRLKRVMSRDGSTEEQVLARMDNQWSDVMKVALSDVRIKNSTLDLTEEQVLKIHRHILNRIKKGWN